jgi:two-component system sensor histidine kinase/response regulator
VIHTVTNGREVLDRLTAEDFDLLLLDLHMPEIDGFQVIRTIRQREQGTAAHLPVIALTARSRKEDRERCLAAGMDDFLAKPVTASDLLAAIDRAVPTCTTPAPCGTCLTPSAILSACENDPALLQKLCRWFRERVPEHLAALTGARDSRDLGRVREAAHKLASMLAVFSTPAGQLASEMEDRAANGELPAALKLASQVELATTELLRLTDGLSLDQLRTLNASDSLRE